MAARPQAVGSPGLLAPSPAPPSTRELPIFAARRPSTAAHFGISRVLHGTGGGEIYGGWGARCAARGRSGTVDGMELPFDFRGRPFSVAEALKGGIRPDRLRRRDLRSDFHGVRVPDRLTDSFETRVRAYATRLRDGQFFSHITAARWWGMRLPWRLESEPIHVTTVLPHRTPRTRGVIGHHVGQPGPELVSHCGLMLPRPEECWRMLSSTLSFDDLVIAGDGLVSRRDPLATVEHLRQAVARNTGCRGNLALRAAFEQVRPRTDSARETSLRLLLTRARLPEPEVNALLTMPGERPRFGDLVFVTWGVAVEYEGIHHQQSRATYLTDLERFDQLGSRWRFVRVTKEHPDDVVVALVTQALRDAGWAP